MASLRHLKPRWWETCEHLVGRFQSEINVMITGSVPTNIFSDMLKDYKVHCKWEISSLQRFSKIGYCWNIELAKAIMPWSKRIHTNNTSNPKLVILNVPPCCSHTVLIESLLGVVDICPVAVGLDRIELLSSSSLSIQPTLNLHSHSAELGRRCSVSSIIRLLCSMGIF